MSYTGDGEIHATLRRADAQPSLVVGRTTSTVIASPESTDGAYSLYRLDLGPKAKGAKPHFHRTFTEAFHVLSGSVRLFDGETWVDGRAGDHLVIPPGGIHAFHNDEDEPTTMLMLSVQAVAREAYFAELADVIASGRTLLPDAWTALYARHDQFMV